MLWIRARPRRRTTGVDLYVEVWEGTPGLIGTGGRLWETADMDEEQGRRVPLDATEYERWQQTAESNLAAARREADAEAHHIACALAEQAAQCALKGLLHGFGAAREAYGHGLVRLACRGCNGVRR